MEESKSTNSPTTELLEEEEKLNLPDSDETKNEIKTDSAVKTDIKKEENDFAFPFIQAGFGIILMIALLSIILAIAKKRKTGKE